MPGTKTKRVKDLSVGDVVLYDGKQRRVYKVDDSNVYLLVVGDNSKCHTLILSARSMMLLEFITTE